MMEKSRTKDGSDKKEDLEKARVLYSDELECFEIFKKKTGGVIHQHKKVEVTEHNKEFIAEKNSSFKIIVHEKEVCDKRTKAGKKIVKTYTYEYWGKEYKTLKSLNKERGGVRILVDIKFHTLLDIIPYYPYIISTCCSSDGKEYIVISEESHPEDEYKTSLRFGWEREYTEYYRKSLQEHYREVVLRYFNPAGRECIETVKFDPVTLIGSLKNNIDTNFPVRWNFKDAPRTFYSSPSIVGRNEIKISKEDFEHCLGEVVEVYYVKDYKDGERPLYLG